MKRFKCVVTRTDKYIIDLDETILNEQWMEEFRQVFYNFHDYEEHAEHIAQFRARFGGRFIEGYGVPLDNGKKPYFADEKDVNKGISIKVISEDDDCEVDVDEIVLP